MNIEPGQSLLHYRVVEKLGEGGMGQVWKAIDTNLDREVAIKVLPEAFASDANRLARFEREAKLLAALNHPHIASVFGLHESVPAAGSEQPGVRFLAMELVAGEDLSQRLKRGPLSEEVTLGVARQVAEALEAAHGAGIVHRDLKPANVVIDADNNVKVLDFGLAKATDGESGSSGADPAMSPTITSMGTVAGMIMGTAAYMSPEQARGRVIDHRADIWSFGCLVYETLTGKLTFHGETISDTLAAVLAKEPDWEPLDRVASPAVRDLVRRCLRKDARTRFQSIGDVRITVDEIASGERHEQVSAVPVAAGMSTLKIALAVALAVVLTAIVSALILRPDAPSASGPTRKFEVVLDSPISGNRPIVVSPDGHRVAYVLDHRLWVRELDRIRAREMPGTQGAKDPFWSPDSRSVGIQIGGALHRMSLDDSAPVMICAVPGAFSGAVWLADGRILFNVVRGSLMSVPASGGDPEKILAPEGNQVDFHLPSVLPDGRTLLFSLHRSEGVDTIVAFRDGELKTVLQIEGQARTTPQVLNLPVWSPTGHLLYERNQGLVGIWAAPFSPETLELTGEPFLLVPDGRAPSVSEDGLLAYTLDQNVGPRQLVIVDANGTIIEKIGEPTVGLSNPAISPDGKTIVATVNEGGNLNLWSFDVASGHGYRLVRSAESEDGADWSPDGTEIAYSCGSAEGMSTCIVSIEDETVRRVGSLAGTPVWTPDGHRLVVGTFGRRERGLMVIDLEGGGEPEPWLIGTVDVRGQDVSASGNRISFWLGEASSPGLVVTSFPESSSRRQVGGSNFGEAHWSPDAERLYFIEGQSLKAVQMRGPTGLAMDPPRELFAIDGRNGLFEYGFAVMPGVERFVMIQTAGGEPSRPAYFVVENWFGEFEGR